MESRLFIFFFFFFQAEDGIRDWSVTGVQTCALPISPLAARTTGGRAGRGPLRGSRRTAVDRPSGRGSQIGRASCRERVQISVVAVSLKKKNKKERAGVVTENSERVRNTGEKSEQCQR